MSDIEMLKEVESANTPAIFKMLTQGFEKELEDLINKHGIDSAIGMEDYRIARKTVLWLARMKSREANISPRLDLIVKELMNDDE